MYALVVLAVATASMAAASTSIDQMSPDMQKTVTSSPAYQETGAMTPSDEGSGPYPAIMTTLPSLPSHVIYQPKNLAAVESKGLAVLLWGNGGCVDDGASARFHLTEIASHGYVVIAPGKILSGPSVSAKIAMAPPNFMATDDRGMLSGLEWALQENKRPESDFYGKIDPDKVAVSGHSCGGILSIKIASFDKRIKAVVIHNSGVFPNKPERPTLITDKAWLQDLSTPILYVVGNETDVGYPVALDDYRRIEHVPVFFASLLTAGHDGTFAQKNGGAAAKVAVDWLEWHLRNSEVAARTFTGGVCGLCTDSQWDVQKKGF